MRYTQNVSDIINSLITQNELRPNVEIILSEFAHDALRELNNDTLPVLKQQRFTLPANRILPFPKDYIDWVKIGVLYQEGVKPLAQNTYMTSGVPLNGTQTITPTIYQSSIVPITTPDYQTFPFQAYGGRNESWGNGSNLGGFTVSRSNKVIQFSSDIPSGPIYMAWISDCFECNEETLVHPYAIQWLKDQIMYDYYLRRKDPLAPSFEARRDKELFWMRKRFMELSKEDIINIWEQTFGANE